MAFRLWLQLVFLALALCFSATTLSESNSSLQPSCIADERSALLQFKHSFRIDCSVSVANSPYNTSITPRPKVESWVDGTNANCCAWDGVVCDNKTGHVIWLNLVRSCLYGTFPHNSTLFSLTHLNSLFLSFNHFNFSAIPSEIGHLVNLQYLSLFGSSFRGQIPAELSNLSGLLELQIGDEFFRSLSLNLKLSNRVLEKLTQNLTRLQFLRTENVDMSSTELILFTNFTLLKSLLIEFSNLNGQLPPNVFQMTHLENLSLAGNLDLEGSLPDEFQWHSPLKEIFLDMTSMSGELPPSIGRLANLERLYVIGSQFSGTIPSSIGNLTKLSVLGLSDNDFTGMVPSSITNLTGLTVLYLSHLEVRLGHLISYLPKLTQLQELSLGGINLSYIQPFLANLTELVTLAFTQVAGPFPQWLSNLTNIQMLGLSGNGANLFGNFETLHSLNNLASLVLSGASLTFPKPPSPSNSRTNSSHLKLNILEISLCNLTEFPHFLRHQNELQLLTLNQNHITGKIPQWFVNVTQESLLFLDLSNNKLSGFEQPSVVLPWTHLEIFNIASNEFQGFLPTPQPSVLVYNASNNKLNGVIPHQICIAKSLIVLDLSNNSMRGQIPQCVGDQLGDSLQVLDLRGNNFSGTIPSTHTTACQLKMINLSENKFEGQLPRSLINCNKLVVLDIGKNRINDNFPSWLGSLPRLQVLVLGHNNFHGSIGDKNNSSPHFRHLQIIDVSHNSHSGNLPQSYLKNWDEVMVSKEDRVDLSNNVWFGLNMKFLHRGISLFVVHLGYSMTITNKGNQQLYTKIINVFRIIDLSSNKFTGQIPDGIGDLNGLQALNLSNNNLHGRIPKSLGNMADLEALDLSQNMLCGEIPQELSQLTYLEVFNVSYNHLVGPVPQGNQFNTFDGSSYEGNLGLCGSLLASKCIDGDAPMLPPLATDESDGQYDLIDWIVRSFGWLGGFIVGFVIGKLYITDKYHEWFVEMFQMKPRRKFKRVTRHMR